MPIVSFTDPKTGQIVTRVRELTNKNIVFAEINFGFVDYLHEEALKILATDIGSRYTTYYKKKRSGKLTFSTSFFYIQLFQGNPIGLDQTDIINRFITGFCDRSSTGKLERIIQIPFHTKISFIGIYMP